LSFIGIIFHCSLILLREAEVFMNISVNKGAPVYSSSEIVITNIMEARAAKWMAFRLFLCAECECNMAGA
jgi:hypothetical protein